MTTEQLLAMYGKPLYAGGHEGAIHWHPNTSHTWLGKWRTLIGVFYLRECVCGAYERWGNPDGR
jgi:hypothetical protein